MLNQHRVLEPQMPSSGDPVYTSLQSQVAPATAYSQSVSPFTANPNVNGTLSSKDSSYCDSDRATLDQFDEPLTTRTAEAHTSLLHPTPRSGMCMMAHNLQFLPSSEEIPSLSPFGLPDTPIGEESLHSHPHIPQPSDYNMASSSFDSHLQRSQLAPPSSSPEMKPLGYDQAAPWAAWKPDTTTDIWYPARVSNGLPDDNSWQNQHSYSLPWSGNNPSYPHLEEFNSHESNNYGMGDGIPLSSFGRTIAFPSFSPIAHPSYAAAPVSQMGSAGLTHGYPLPPQPTHLASTQPMYSDTDLGSPNQNTANSLSPSSFTPSTEEGTSPQQVGEGSGIEADPNYTNERNAFLIDCKRRGLSYKAIKRVGGFKEAESTLRGRYRTLTKAKEQRVRKPQWRDKDVRLLCEGVKLHAETPSTYSPLNINEPPKVSWKKVAEHIKANGGSYHFGNATCKKKWCDLHGITR
ncbi:hypothetical protein N7457_006235 [Penicillium paradoxum]|uniref:uncharacterized protein n=1 Tax=Penicillium paradoxum TaxID=176176 RepID=UPI0025467FC1|nr:uncharacterized protein N7457_006235 [Penicillium paradoxum]KAJ5781075.1 hypothetical protein N7457_006235 [Penicillium paradoxum]